MKTSAPGAGAGSTHSTTATAKRNAVSTSAAAASDRSTGSRTPIRQLGVKQIKLSRSQRGSSFFGVLFRAALWDSVFGYRGHANARAPAVLARFCSMPISFQSRFFFEPTTLSYTHARWPVAQYAPLFSLGGVVLHVRTRHPSGSSHWTAPRGGVRPALALTSPRKPSVPGCVQVVRVRAGKHVP